MAEIEIVGPAATKYLAYVSIAEDTGLALRLYERLASLPDPIDDQEMAELVGLWIAIAATYARCFGKGMREHYAATIVPLHGERFGAHRWLLNHRNRYIAHLDRRSPDEMFQAFAVLRDNGDIEIRHKGQRWLAPDRESRLHIEKLLRYVDMKARQRRENAAKVLADAIATMESRRLQGALDSGKPIRINTVSDTVEEARRRKR